MNDKKQAYLFLTISLLIIAGIVLLIFTKPKPTKIINPVNNTQNKTKEVILNKICTNSETKDIAIHECDSGKYFYTYPNGLIMDAGVTIYDQNGEYIITCGGYKTYISDEARNEESEICKKYPRNKCIIAKESCLKK